jgi:hypothetical protein
VISVSAASGRRVSRHLCLFLSDQSENDHHDADAYDCAGDLADRPHHHHGIVGLRRDRHHSEEKRRCQNYQNTTDNDNPPIPLPHVSFLIGWRIQPFAVGIDRVGEIKALHLNRGSTVANGKNTRPPTVIHAERILMSALRRGPYRDQEYRSAPHESEAECKERAALLRCGLRHASDNSNSRDDKFGGGDTGSADRHKSCTNDIRSRPTGSSRPSRPG